MALPRDACRNSRGCARNSATTSCGTWVRSGSPACRAIRRTTRRPPIASASSPTARRRPRRCASTASLSRSTTGRSAEGCSCPTTRLPIPRGARSSWRRDCATACGCTSARPLCSIEPGRVVTSAGTVFARRVVVAVDGRLEVLLPQLADRVRTARLQMLATAPVRPRLPCPVVRPLGLRLRAAGSGRAAVRRRRTRPVRAGRVDDGRAPDRRRAGLHRERGTAHGRRAAGRRHAPLGGVGRLHGRRQALW